MAQESEGIEKPVYYLNRIIHGPEARYTSIGRPCLALVFVAQNLIHYLLSFTVHIVTRCDPIKFLLARTVLIGRAARWFLILSEYDLKCMVPRAIKSQAYADLLAIFPFGTFKLPIKELLSDDLQDNFIAASLDEWSMEFDDSLAEKKRGAGVILRKGSEEIRLSFKLEFE